MDTYTVRPDSSTGSLVNAALSPPSVRPDSSTGSLVNAALSPPSVRPELVEGYEHLNYSKDIQVSSNHTRSRLLFSFLSNP